MNEFFKKAKQEYAEDKLYDALTPNQKLWVLKRDDIAAKYGISQRFVKHFLEADFHITWDDAQKCIAWILDHFETEQDRQEVRQVLVEILLGDVGKYSVIAVD